MPIQGLLVLQRFADGSALLCLRPNGDRIRVRCVPDAMSLAAFDRRNPGLTYRQRVEAVGGLVEDS